MSRWVATALVLSLALNLGFGLAWFGNRRAQPPRHPRFEELHRGENGRPRLHRGHENGKWAQRRAHRLHRELGLDPIRRDRLYGTLEPLEPEIASTRSELLNARRGFAEALHVEQPDRDRVMQLRLEVSRLQAQLDSLVAEALLREATVLDLEERWRSGPWSPHFEQTPPIEEKER